MAQDNSDRNSGGTRCATAAEIVRYRQEYSMVVVNAQTSGEEPVDFNTWLATKGLRNCGG